MEKNSSHTPALTGFGKDFKGYPYCVLMINSVTQTEVTNSDLIELLELDEDRVVLTVPKNSCQVGHSVILLIFPDLKRVTVKKASKLGAKLEEGCIQATGKIEQLDVISSELAKISCHLSQFKKEKWNLLLKQNHNRQRKMDDLLKKAQG